MSGTDYVFYPVIGNGESSTPYTWQNATINFDTGSYWAQVDSFETLTIGTTPTTGTVPGTGANIGLIAGAIDPFLLGYYTPDPAEGDPYITFPSNGAFSVDVVLNSGSVSIDNLLLAGFNEYADVITSAPTQFPTLDVQTATLTVTGDILDTGSVVFPTIDTPLGPINSATASGGGTIDLGQGASVDLAQTTGTVVPFDITFNFNDGDGNVLEIDGDSVSNPTAFQGTITGFAPGDSILLPNIASMVGTVATTGSYDVATGVLTIVVGDPTTIDINLPSLTNASIVPSGTGIEIQTTCYLHGTNILTDRGEVAVEKLAIGDRVITRSGQAKPIRWIGRRSYEGAFAASNPELAPILIRAGALDDGVPHRDLYVSPEHAMYIDGVLIPARHLVNNSSILTTQEIGPIRYFHIELEEHAVIYAEGAPAETFVDCDSRHIFHNFADYAELYPNDAPIPWRTCARVVERGARLIAVNRRLAARAASLGLTPAVIGPVAGYIDHADQSGISGWAWCQAAPARPLRLEVLEDDRVIGSVLADQYREDLQAAGIGDGRHGFALTFTRPLDPFTRHTLTVRRPADRAVVSEPVVVEPAMHLDGPTRSAFAAWLRHATAHVQTAAEAETLLDLLRAESEQARRARLRLLRGVGPVERRRGADRAPTRRALVIDADWPRPDQDAGSQAIVSHMRALQRLRWHVSFAATTALADNGEAKARLEALGITCLTGGSVEELLHETVDQYQLVYLHRLAVAGAYAGLVRQHQRRARLIYSVADLHHLRLARQAAMEARPELERHAAFVRRQEVLAAHQADVVITHSPVEASLLSSDAPGVAVAVVPWVVRPRAGLQPWQQREGVALVANLRHEPNVDGLLWLFREVMPLVWEAAPIVLSVAGTGLPAGVARTLAHPHLRVLGAVREVWPLLAASRLAVAPLRYGAGIKGKVLEAWAAGLPCAMTPIAAEGLPPADTVAADAAGLARLILDLHSDPARNSAAARVGRAALRRHFSQKCVDIALAAAIDGSAASPSDGGARKSAPTRTMGSELRA